MDKLLKDLLNAPGISGYEETVAEIIKKELEKAATALKQTISEMSYQKKEPAKKRL
jgi:putative aminopeptidase FrvX